MNKITLNEPATRWSDRRRSVSFDHRAFWQPMLVSSGIVLGSVRTCDVTLISTEVEIEKRRISPYFHHKCMYPVSVHDVLILLFSIKYERAKEVVSVGNNLSQRKTQFYTFFT